MYTCEWRVVPVETESWQGACVCVVVVVRYVIERCWSWLNEMALMMLLLLLLLRVAVLAVCSRCLTPCPSRYQRVSSMVQWTNSTTLTAICTRKYVVDDPDIYVNFKAHSHHIMLLVSGPFTLLWLNGANWQFTPLNLLQTTGSVILFLLWWCKQSIISNTQSK